MSETMNWLRRLGQNRLLDVGAVLVTVLVIVYWGTILPQRWSDFDFNNYYVSGRMLLEGQNPYSTSLQEMSRSLGFRYAADLPHAGYPPSFIWLFAALAALPPRVAFGIWLAIEIGCLIVVLGLTRRLLGERLSRRGWLFVAALTITSRTVSYGLYYSQVQLFLTAVILAAYVAHRAGRHGWACLAVSAAGILKLYPLALLPWFVWSGKGTARARACRLAGAIGLAIMVILLSGPSLWRDFLQFSLPMDTEEAIARTFHFSLPALVTNLGYWYHGFNPTPQAKEWWWFVGTATALAVIASGYGLCLLSPRDPEAQFCVLCIAMLSGTLTMQGHYFVFLVFPLAVAATRIAARPTPGKVFCLIAIIVAVNCVDPPISPFLWRHPFLYILVSNVPLYGLFGLGLFFGRELWVHRVTVSRLP